MFKEINHEREEEEEKKRREIVMERNCHNKMEITINQLRNCDLQSVILRRSLK